MPTVTVFLSKKLQGLTDASELAKLIEEDIASVYDIAVKVEISNTVCGQPEASLLLTDFGGLDTTDIDNIAEAAAGALADYFGKELDQKSVAFTMHCSVYLDIFIDVV